MHFADLLRVRDVHLQLTSHGPDRRVAPFVDLGLNLARAQPDAEVAVGPWEEHVRRGGVVHLS